MIVPHPAAAPLILAADDAAVTASASDGQLLLAAGVAIATIVVLITAFKLHPFLALIAGAGVLGVLAQYPLADILTSFTDGFGSTAGGVGILIALGAMIGKLLADSGGADRIVDSVTSRVSDRGLPWAMALIAAVLGLPLFFEVGVVLLVPVVLLVSKRTWAAPCCWASWSPSPPSSSAGPCSGCWSPAWSPRPHRST